MFLNPKRPSENVVDFEAAVAVKFATSKLLNILEKLETILRAEVEVKTEGQSENVAVH